MRLSIPAEIRDEVKDSEAKRLATAFAIKFRSKPYVDKKDLQSWLFSNKRHLLDKIWLKYRQMVS